MTMDMTLPCRKCEACRKARKGMWTLRAKAEVAAAPRTWWCTFTVPAHIHYKVFCHIKGAEKLSDDALFRERCRVIGNWFTKYCKRVRKRLHALPDGTVVDWEDTRFRFLMVFEKHPGKPPFFQNKGMPHMHALIHETVGRPSLVKRRIQHHWPWFSTAKLIGDEADDISKTVHYVCKYIAKDMETRVRSSIYPTYGNYTPDWHSVSAVPSNPILGAGGNVLATALEREIVTYRSTQRNKMELSAQAEAPPSGGVLPVGDD